MADLKEHLSLLELEILNLELEILEIDRLNGKLSIERIKNLSTEEDNANGERAVDYYEKARTNLEAGLYMGLGYSFEREAYRLFLKGVKQSDCPKCWYGVGLCLYCGYGVEQYAALGERILNEALPKIERLKDDAEARIILYEYYRDGYVVDKDEKKAEKYLEITDCPRAFYYASLTKNANKRGVLELLRKALDGGFPLSYYALGTLYRRGKWMNCTANIEIDLIKAKGFFTKGAELGCALCRRSVAEIELVKKGFDVENGELLKCNLYEREVHIPDIVSKIGEGAFLELKTDTLYLPDSVTELPENAFSQSSLPKKIVGKHINASSYKAKLATKKATEQAGKFMSNAKLATKKATEQAGKFMSNAKSKIAPVFEENSHIAWSIVSAIIIALLIPIPHITGLLSFSFPSLVPLIFYIVGAVGAVVFAIWAIVDSYFPDDFWENWVSFFLIPLASLVIFVVGIFYGGIIPDKWSFIPISVEITIALAIVACIICAATDNYIVFNIPIALGGAAVIVGGLISGVFALNMPSIIMIVLYACLLVVSIGFAIYGLVNDENLCILSSPSIILAAIGICFSGGFAWWGHAIIIASIIILICIASDSL